MVINGSLYCQVAVTLCFKDRGLYAYSINLMHRKISLRVGAVINMLFELNLLINQEK